MNEDYIGSRARIGVVIPSTNTAVEYDLQRFHFEGLTWHPSRFWVELSGWEEESERTGQDLSQVFETFLERIRVEIPISIRNVLSARVHHLMLGMSAETFWGGLQGSIEFEKRIVDQIGDMGLTTGATACRRALELFKARSVSVITPYPKVGDENVRRFFGDLGFEVKAVHGLCRPSAQAIAGTPRSQVFDAVRRVDADDVDAIVQVGTNLSTLDMFPVIEQWLGKPCLPINVTTAWHALRAVGIRDRFSGVGRLMEEF